MARATTVLRYLIDTGHLSPKGFSALAYAETRPIAPNDTEKGRERNRRVELVLLRNKS
jgi:chemotaxis protein MotB